jgi:PAS domain S-box-containing protein
MSKRYFGIDISERDPAEQAKRRTDELFRALIENSSDVITIIDAQGIIRYESPSVERVLGYSAAELVGVNFVDLVHPEDVGLSNAALEALASESGTPGIQLMEVRCRHKDRSWRLLEGVAKILDTPPARSIVINSRDITERKQRERELEAIATVSAALRTAASHAEMLPVILDQLLDLLNVEGAALAMRNPVSG